MIEFPLRISGRSKLALAALLALSLSAEMPAQTLARPGWAGSGMAAQSWFRHAVLYRIDTRSFTHAAANPGADSASSSGTLKGITEHLDYIRNIGIDAILLEPLAAIGSPAPVDPAIGTIDDFDELSLQASKRNLRILITLPQPDAALARYWLTRGIAGFYIPVPATAAALQPIRKLLPSFVGQRILITEADLLATAPPTKSPANELQFDSAILKLPTPPPPNVAGQLRSALEASQVLLRTGTPVLATDASATPRSITRFAPPEHRVDAAKLLAAILLLNRSVPVIDAGQELGIASPDGKAVMIPWGNVAPPQPDSQPEANSAIQPATKPVAPPTSTDRYVPYIAPVGPAKPAAVAPPDPLSAAGQELDENSVLSFYRSLIQLHHGRPSVRDGDEILLNEDDANAVVLIRKPSGAGPLNHSLVVLCNLSPQTLHLSLKGDLTRLQLRGSFLRAVLHAEKESVSMNLNTVILPAFGLYIGELRY